jgi:phage/plasmid-like protein (TIGR03299 family)
VGEEPILSNDVLQLAGLDWKVERVPLFVETRTQDNTSLTHDMVNGNFAIRRASDSKILGIVGNRYREIQNETALSLMDSLVTIGQMRYHTAGSLFEGRKVWLLAQLPGVIEPVKGDAVGRFVLLCNTHDGTGSLKVFMTPIRVVCANTMTLAMNSREPGRTVSLQHSVNIMGKLEKAREILGIAEKEYAAYGELMTAFAKVQIDEKKWDEFALHVLPDPVKLGASNLQASLRRTELRLLFENGIGQDIPGVAGTGWAAMNAVTQWVTHLAGANGSPEKRNENRFNSAIMGPNTLITNRAVSKLSSYVS